MIETEKMKKHIAFKTTIRVVQVMFLTKVLPEGEDPRGSSEGPCSDGTKLSWWPRNPRQW